jgi:hypothetical protein
MSIVSKAIRDVLSGVPLAKVWNDASTSFENFVTQIGNKSQIAATAIAQTEAVVKQGLSDAISVADSALGQHAADVAKIVEDGLDAALAGATGGASIQYNAIIDAGIEDLAGIVVTAAHAWAAKVKASLINAPATAAPQQQAQQQQQN